MDHTALYRAFNDHMVEFVGAIQILFPDNVDIRSAKNGILLMKNSNPKILSKIWHQYISLPYQSEIEAGDLGFFIDKDYSYDVSGADGGNEIMAKINVLREPVRCMGENNQSKSIHYIQNLTKLSVMMYGVALPPSAP
jgi:hypothetical protein